MSNAEPTADRKLVQLVPGRKPVIRLGILRLTDAAPLIVAKEFGFFEEEGLEVALAVEPSWANIADKVSYGLLDGGMMLPALALAVSLGLRGPGLPLTIPLALSLNGNTVSLAPALVEAVRTGAAGEDALALGRGFAALLRRMRHAPRIGIVHPFSSHNLLLRYWLAACGVDPDREIGFDVIPPARMVAAMESGRIVGFCAGAPWGEVARRAGLAETLLPSSAIWQNHPEKIFAVGRRYAEAHPARLAALLRALLRAALHCDDPANAAGVASLVASPTYLDLDADTVRASLPGTNGVNESRFYRSAATFPWRSQARWFLAEMIRWGYLPAGLDVAAAAQAIYRPDLYAVAATALGLPVPPQDSKSEGAHATEWQLAPGIAMEPDRFCDGAVFSAQNFTASPASTTATAWSQP